MNTKSCGKDRWRCNKFTKGNSKMASKGKGKDKKGSKKEKVVEEPPPPPEEKKEDEVEEKQEENQVEEPTPEEQEPPKEPTPPPEYDEPTLAELIVEEYEGEKVRGLYDGDGEACFSGGHKYKGQFSQGLMHGKGKYTWADGVTYEGDFTMNEITGKGLYTWPDRSTYEGEVVKGKRNGHGTFKCPYCPSSYTGEWYDGKRHGTGRIQYDTEGHSFYEGDWVNNKRHGYGVRRYRSGNVYEGDWANNTRHGQGVMRWVDIDQSYSGQWEHGIQHGHGEHTWYLRRLPSSQYPLRNQFIGDFVYSKRHGFGVFLYANGAKYEGEWVNNKKNGRGVFTFKNGRVFEGVFVDDRMAEFPAFTMDGTNTPDLSEIRTRTPDPAGPNIGGPGTARSDSSRNTLGPSMTLDLDHLLNDFNENDREEEVKQVLFVILRHMTTLKKVYNYYSSLGHDASPDNTFIMTRLQFWRFLKDCQFHHKETTLMEIDRILAPDKEATDIHSPLDKLLVREFLNNIITLAYYLFREECLDNCKGVLAWCMDKAIKENVIPDSCDVQGYFLYDPRRAVNALGYMDRCWEVYRAVCSPNKYAPYEPTLKMREFLFMLNDYRLINERLTPKRILEVLSADDPMAYDHKDCNLEIEMTFLEFFEALIGCAKIYVTEEIVKDPTTPRPSTVVSHSQTSYSGTTPGTQSRTSQREDDSEDPGTTGQASPNQTGPSETVSPGPRSSSEVTAKGSGADTSKLDVSGSQQQVDEGQQDDSNIAVDEKAGDDGRQFGMEESQPTLLQSMLSMGAEQEEQLQELEEEMDEETREFNFWTHQIHIFFLRKLFPAYQHMLELQSGKERVRLEKEAAAIQAEKQREERAKAIEAARIAQQQAEEAKAKEAAEKAASGESVPDVEVNTDARPSPSRSPAKGRWDSLLSKADR
ncbi:radial spoke head 10 homolog B-like isoform X2 [Amphiura filiformis]|uniref:radial spoke head 10 homolog B-like isoform X2 n=1 Tax=Amphiura filiformis TaxID=82378 RepID=UPI003B20F452